LAEHLSVGGAILEATSEVALSGDLKAGVLAHLNDIATPASVFGRSVIFPGPGHGGPEGTATALENAWHGRSARHTVGEWPGLGAAFVHSIEASGAGSWP